MRTFSKYLSVALLGSVILSSCSRPVAYFQPTAREQFKSTQTAAVAVATPTESVEATVAESSIPEVIPAPVEQLNQTKQAVSQIEAYVRNDSKLASNKKLSKRMARLNELLTTTSTKAALAPTAASTQKTTLMQRMLLKKLDKKIKNHVAPNDTKEVTSNLRLGLIIGGVGLLIWILGTGLLAVIGFIGFIVGAGLIVLDLVSR